MPASPTALRAVTRANRIAYSARAAGGGLSFASPAAASGAGSVPGGFRGPTIPRAAQGAGRTARLEVERRAELPEALQLGYGDATRAGPVGRSGRHELPRPRLG